MNDFIKKYPALTFLINFILMLLVAAISVIGTLKYLEKTYAHDFNRMSELIQVIHDVIINL